MTECVQGIIYLAGKKNYLCFKWAQSEERSSNGKHMAPDDAMTGGRETGMEIKLR